jgi:beta-RFAP synthase
MVYAHGVALMARRLHRSRFEDFSLGGPSPFFQKGKYYVPPERFAPVSFDRGSRANDAWEFDGLLADRVEPIVEKLRAHRDVPAVTDAWHIKVLRSAPIHQGWGTGTQLALATARLWCQLAGASDWDARKAAAWVGRGLRSGIGVAGFDHGGFLIDRGKRPDDPNPSQVEHIALPKEWTWLLVEPRFETGMHGEAERGALASITKPDIGIVKELMHLGQAVLPQAARDRNFETFAETLTHYNRLAGTFYSKIQGGIYGSRVIEARIELLRSYGAVGVGQSSWGPGLFCIFPNRGDALRFETRYEIPDCKLLVSWTSEGARCDL